MYLLLGKVPTKVFAAFGPTPSLVICILHIFIIIGRARKKLKVEKEGIFSGTETGRDRRRAATGKLEEERREGGLLATVADNGSMETMDGTGSIAEWVVISMSSIRNVNGWRRMAETT